MISVARAIFSSVSARVIRRPARANRVVASACAAGTAKARAQGQVTASTATATGKLIDASIPSQTSADVADKPSVSGAIQRAARSANSLSFGRDASACSVRCRRVAATVCSPILLTCMNTGAPRLSEPLSSCAPSPRVSGCDSPVSNDSSKSLVPSTINPSAATSSPLATRITCPGSSSATATAVTPRSCGNADNTHAAAGAALVKRSINLSEDSRADVSR